MDQLSSCVSFKMANYPLYQVLINKREQVFLLCVRVLLCMSVSVCLLYRCFWHLIVRLSVCLSVCQDGPKLDVFDRIPKASGGYHACAETCR